MLNHSFNIYSQNHWFAITISKMIQLSDTQDVEFKASHPLDRVIPSKEG